MFRRIVSQLFPKVKKDREKYQKIASMKTQFFPHLRTKNEIDVRRNFRSVYFAH